MLCRTIRKSKILIIYNPYIIENDFLLIVLQNK